MASQRCGKPPRVRDGGQATGTASFVRFAYLLEHVGSWSIPDLDDLLVEITRDRELSEPEREELLTCLYAVLWRRAQEELAQGAANGGGHLEE